LCWRKGNGHGGDREDYSDEPPRPPRRRDDPYDDEPPRARRRRDEEYDDEPPRRPRRRDEEYDDEPPRRPRRREDDDDYPSIRRRQPLSGMDGLFANTHVVVLVLFSCLCSFIAMILGVVGLATCKDETAKRNALITTILGGVFFVLQIAGRFAANVR
jgi:hypothetical protein